MPSRKSSPKKEKERIPQHWQYWPEEKPTHVRQGFPGPIPCPHCSEKLAAGGMHAVVCDGKLTGNTDCKFTCIACQETFTLKVV